MSKAIGIGSVGLAALMVHSALAQPVASLDDQARTSPLTMAAAQPSTLGITGGETVAALPAALAPVMRDLNVRLGDSPRQLQAGSTALESTARVAEFYRRRHYRPAWLNDAGQPSTLAGQLLQVILQAETEGLRPTDYHSSEIYTALRSLQIAFATTPRQLANFDLLLSDAFLTYASHLLAGRLDPQHLEQDWQLQPRSQDLGLVLENALQTRDLETSLQTLLVPYPQYAQLREALAGYRELAANGGWPLIETGAKLEPGDKGPRIAQLRARLRASGDLLDTQRPLVPDTIYGIDLLDAVKHFQSRHGLATDGVVGPNTLAELNIPVEQRIRQIEINLERWRWLPANLGSRYITVNVPGYRMSVIEDGREVLSSKVIVGQTKRPTPLFSAEMSYLVFSPYWTVPYTIAVEDKLPQLRRNPYALRGDGIRVFSNGHEVNPGSVNWASLGRGHFPYTLRQDPGAKNALGGVKFMFPNRHSVYIHDTPSRYLFQRAQRTFSSGCIRTDKPIELAQYLLRDLPQWDHDSIIAATRRGKARRVDLPEPLPVYVQYWTAWVDADGTIEFRDDIYDRDVALAQAFYAG